MCLYICVCIHFRDPPEFRLVASVLNSQAFECKWSEWNYPEKFLCEPRFSVGNPRTHRLGPTRLLLKERDEKLIDRLFIRMSIFLILR